MVGNVSGDNVRFERVRGLRIGPDGSRKHQEARAHEQQDMSQYFLMRCSVDECREGRLGEKEGASRRR